MSEYWNSFSGMGVIDPKTFDPDDFFSWTSCEVKVEDIITDDGIQSRKNGLNQSVVDDYADRWKNGSEPPHIYIVIIGRKFYVSRGFHRVAAARKLGKETIKCEAIVSTYDDACEIAENDNLKHGLAYTPADKRNIFERKMKRKDHPWPKWSTRKIAAHLGVSHQTVARWRAEVSQALHLPDVITGEDGKEYPASKTEQSKPPKTWQQRLAAEPEDDIDIAAREAGQAKRQEIQATIEALQEKLSALPEVPSLGQQYERLELERQLAAAQNALAIAPAAAASAKRNALNGARTEGTDEPKPQDGPLRGVSTALLEQAVREAQDADEPQAGESKPVPPTEATTLDQLPKVDPEEPARLVETNIGADCVGTLTEQISAIKLANWMHLELKEWQERPGTTQYLYVANALGLIDYVLKLIAETRFAGMLLEQRTDLQQRLDAIAAQLDVKQEAKTS